MIDDLDVVAVGIEHERGVVARVVSRALPRRAVVAMTRRRERVMERGDCAPVRRSERHVDVLGRRTSSSVKDPPAASVRSRQEPEEGSSDT